MTERLAALAIVFAVITATTIGGDPTYATRGVVTSANEIEIIVSRMKHRGDITIELSPDTHVEGTIKIGVIVSVRYHDEHGRHVATAISVERPD